MKPSIQLAPRSGVLARAERAGHRGGRARARPRRAAAGWRGRRACREAVAVGDAPQRLAPGAGELLVLEQRERALTPSTSVASCAPVSSSAPTPAPGRPTATAQHDARAAPGDRARVAAAHVAVAQDPRERRHRGHQVGGVAVQRGAVGERAAARPRARPGGRRAGRRRRAWPARRRSPRSLARALARAAAAACTVVPQRPAWIRSSASSGYHSSRNASLNVPCPRLRRSAAPRHLEQVQAMQQPAALAVVRAPQVERDLLDLRLGLSRSRRWSRATSCWSGTIGVSSGTSPRRCPTTSSARTSASGMSLPWHSTARVASSSSSRPGERAVADAGERDREPRRRRPPARRTRRGPRRAAAGRRAPSQRATGSSAASKSWSYQAGESTPAP